MKIPVTRTILEKIETRSSIITAWQDGIIQSEMKNIEEFCVEDALECASVIKKIADGKRIRFMGIANNYVLIDKCVRELWASDIFDNCIACEALVLDDMPMKIVGKFYILFNKPTRPTQLFTSEESALDWLLSFKI